MSSAGKYRGQGALVAEEWRLLCQAELKAKEAHMAAYRLLARKADLDAGEGGDGAPSPEEWTAFERTKAEWRGAQREKQEFVAVTAKR